MAAPPPFKAISLWLDAKRIVHKQERMKLDFQASRGDKGKALSASAQNRHEIAVVYR